MWYNYIKKLTSDSERACRGASDDINFIKYGQHADENKEIQISKKMSENDEISLKLRFIDLM